MKQGEQILTSMLLTPHSASGGLSQVRGHCTVTEHPLLSSRSFASTTTTSLKALRTKGNVIFSWDQYFVCSLEATLPLESSQNTAARPPYGLMSLLCLLSPLFPSLPRYSLCLPLISVSFNPSLFPIHPLLLWTQLTVQHEQVRCHSK